VTIAVLVATCPCALALAAPIALSQVSGDLLARGVALTRASALETLAAATDVVLDKTGTLTNGRFRIVRVELSGRANSAECRALASGLEAGSRHPLARAFEEGSAVPVESIRSIPGRGQEGKVDGRTLRIGTESFCRELAAGALPPPERALTSVYLADAQGWLAVFHLEDSMRAGAAETVAALQDAGLRVHLLSGDHPTVVGALAGRLGIGIWRGGAAPQDKFDYAADLQREGRVVAMAGDGLNDAPVLARADVSFAMGGGADAAQRHADCVLLGNTLDELPGTFRRARRAMRIVRQNFGWALAYNAIALPLAATGWIGPWEAAVGMAASSLIVVLNALRAADAAQKREPWKASPSSSPSRSPSYS
jgi:Cu2+-exporting ATPase